jgi:hypothetical protein
LEKYQDDERIMTILGTIGLGRGKPDSQSSHFSNWLSPVFGMGFLVTGLGLL